MKILAMDLDGTLVRDRVVLEEDIKAIKEMRKKGYKLIIATGRSKNGVEKILESYDVEFDFLVLCNGGTIYDGNFQLIRKKTIAKEILEIILHLNDTEDDLLFYADDNKNSMVMKGCFLDKDIEIFGGTISTREEIASNEEISIIGLHSREGTIERAEYFRKVLEEKCGDEVDIFRNTKWIDIAPKGCSKGNGIKEVINLIKEPVEEIYTIGDSWNDVSMFDITKNSYTFNFVEEGLKKHARHHVDYVHQCIEHMLK